MEYWKREIMDNGIIYNRTKFLHFMPKIRQIWHVLLHRALKLTKFKGKRSTSVIYIINSDALNIQQGPVSVRRAGTDNDRLLYTYTTYIGIHPNTTRVIKGIDIN